nr:SpaA isopeptide-forming pilin-related protein [Pseudactinotalea sp. HY160]
MQTGYAFLEGSCVVTALDGSTSTVSLNGPTAENLTNIAPGDQVACTYTNKPLPGTVIWSKVDSTSENLLGGSEWSLTGPGAIGPTVAITDCVGNDPNACTGADQDPAEGQFKLTGLAWGDYTVDETKAPDGYVGTATFTFTIDANNAGTIISQGNITNTPATQTVTLTKIWKGGTTGDAADLNINGTGVTGTTPETSTIPSSPTFPMTDTDNMVTVTATIGSNVTVSEVLAAEIQAGYTPVFACTQDGEGVTLTPDTRWAASFDMPTTGGQVDCKVTNTPVSGSVTWSKVNGNGDRLNGSEWSLTGPDGSSVAIIDCVEASVADCVAGGDIDRSAGGFEIADLAWGDYTLTETKAPPGYQVSTWEYEFTISATTLHKEIGDITNDQQAGPDLPLTGGLGRDHVYIAGAATLLLSLMAYGATKVQRRRSRRSA